MPLILQLTDAGLDAIVAAEAGGTDAVLITQLGLTETAFDQAPTLTALPGEFKRVDMISGEPVAPNVIHMVAYDTSADVYQARGFGLYTDDGTLLATYVAEEPVLAKASLAFAMIAFDIAFSNDVAGVIEFGNSIFSYPPATEEMRGTARLATQARVDAAEDDADDFETIVTPRTLRARLAGLMADIWAAIDAVNDYVVAQIGTLTGRSITGGGLVTGGGNLSADRVLSVSAATGAEIATGTETGKAVTPAAIAAVPQTFGPNQNVLGLGGALMKSGIVALPAQGAASVTFPVAFPTACLAALITPLGDSNATNDNKTWYVSAMSATGISITTRGDNGVGINFRWVAFGH